MALIYASTAPISSNVGDVRKSLTYHPSVWKKHFLSYTPTATEISVAERENHGILKKKVKNLIAHTPKESTANMEIIDAIQRLGVGYHFVEEIDEFLQQIHTQVSKDDADNIRVAALRFRLLRMQGYRASCDVFKKFMDEGGNFKESLINDIEGMLSLYEASYYGVNGEGIMDKALEFSFSHLEPLSSTTNFRLKEALDTPISKTLNRLGAKRFISAYQEDKSHNQDLLHLAKLDFNMTQKVYQRELNHLSRWWEDLDFANKLPFGRDRLVECYFWILGIVFEPHYSKSRIFLAKIAIMFSHADDIYDNYGTLDELRCFTHAVKSWDINAVNKLPPYMKIYYEALLGVYAEVEDKRGVQYALKTVSPLLEAYLKEAEWHHANYIPTVDEYMKVSLPSANSMMVATCALVEMGDDITKRDFDWITNYPLIVQVSDLITRFMDDLVGYGKEPKVTVVDCYMKEHGCSEKEASREISKQVKKAWKDFNDARMEPRAAKLEILERIANYCRSVHLMYFTGDDGFTNSDTRIKSIIKSVLVDPIN